MTTTPLKVLETLGRVITSFGLAKLAKDLDKAKNSTEWLTKNANPILNFIGNETTIGKSFKDYAKLITGSISIVDNTLAILKGDLLDAERTKKLGLISSSLESMAVTTEKLAASKTAANSPKLGFLSVVSG